MPRRRRANDRKGALLGVAAGAAGIALLAGFVWIYSIVQARHVELDPESNCPKAGPKAIHAILIDRSDPITRQQALRVKQEVKRLQQSAQSGARFDLYVIEGNTADILNAVVSVCSPGQGKDASELYQNPGLIQRRFEERFAARLDDAVDKLLDAGTQPVSPIIESVRAAAISSFGGVGLGSIPLAMTIVSDFVQHSENVSHFRSEPNFETLSRSNVWRATQPNLRGAQIRALYLLRPTARRPNGQPIQNRGHQVFWEQLFAASGGLLLSMETI